MEQGIAGRNMEAPRNWKRVSAVTAGVLLLSAVAAVSLQYSRQGAPIPPKVFPADATLHELFGPSGRRRGDQEASEGNDRVELSEGVKGKFRGLDVPDNKRVRESYIVKFKATATEADIQRLCESQANGGRRTQCDSNRRLKRVFSGSQISLTPARLASLMDQFDDLIDFVEVDMEVKALQTAGAWGLDRIDQRALPLNSNYLLAGNQGEGVDVFVLDTGVRTTHTEFGGRARTLWSAFSTSGDGNGHGTHCAGTVGGSTYGVAKKARIFGVKVLDDAGSGSVSGIVAGCDQVITYCKTSGRRCVASMSLGGGFSSSLNLAIASLRAAGIPTTVAAGNENQDACNVSPASERTAITVGATDSTDTKASYSNWGSCVDIHAPGSAITSSISTGDTATATWSGTSMATPHVAGAVALLLSDNPTATVDAIESFLLTAATSGALSGLTGTTVNKLLYVGNLFTSAPTVAGATNPPTSLPPTPIPSVAPTRLPARSPTTRAPTTRPPPRAPTTRRPTTAKPTRRIG